MSVIAKARLLPAAMADCACDIATRLTSSLARFTGLESLPGSVDAEDPLTRWFKAPSIRSFRSLQAGIHREVDATATSDAAAASLNVERDLLNAFLTAALMAACRDLLTRFRTANPTWIAHPRSGRHRIMPSFDQIGAAFVARCTYLSRRLTVQDIAHASQARIITGSVLDLDGTDTWDACITSPPYATRVDYVRATAPELAVLGVAEDAQRGLRRAMLGTPLVKGRARVSVPSESSAAQTLLRRVANHPSHGSANYYLPWLATYVAELEQALAAISACVRPGGPIALVVQDSYYKEIFIDLQLIVEEQMNAAGRQRQQRVDFDAPHLLSHVNTRARRHLEHRKHVESLLIFG
jgi:hypothetical protein